MVTLGGLALAFILEPVPDGPGVSPGEVPSGYTHVTFNTLAGFDFALEIADSVPRGYRPPNLPRAVGVLHGQQVFLKGFMLPYEGDASGITVFALNASFDMCYFGAPVRPNDWILVTMKRGTRAEYTHLPVSVWGRFEVGADGDDGRVGSFYRLVDAHATPDR